MSEGNLILCYDGVCGFCNRSVQIILNNDQQGVMKFAALQSEFAQGIIARHPELQGIDSLVLIEGIKGEEKISTHSTAALKIAAYLGGIWRIFLIGYLLPRPIRDQIYKFIARNRYKIMGKHESCLLPDPSVRMRFIA